MNQAAKAQEPSMEEILASIRRIISDDDAGGKPALTPAAEAPPSPPPAPKAEFPPPRPAPAPAVPPPPSISPPPQAVPSAAAKSPQDEIDAVFSAGEPFASIDDSAPDPEGADVLELTEAMTAPEPENEPHDFRTIDGEADIVFSDPDPEPERNEAPQPIPPDPAEEAPPPPPPPHFSYSADARALLSVEASAAVDSAFNTLAQTVLVQNGRTLEDLVREMLRPMLKAWLDDNLPGLVERLVRAEIERVSRGR